MAIGYPFRTGILRRVLRGREGIAGKATLRIPAIAGILILLISIPMINKTLLTETRLREDSSNLLIMRTDCGFLDVDIALSPYDAIDLTKPLDIGRSVDINFEELVQAAAEGSADRESFRELTGIDLSDETSTSWLYVSLFWLPADPREPGDGAAPECSFADFTALDFEGDDVPMLQEDPPAGVSTEADQGIHVDLTDGTELTFRMLWPGIYQYSHDGHGWFNSWLGKMTAAAQLSFWWTTDDDTSVRSNVTIAVGSPNYEVNVSYGNEDPDSYMDGYSVVFSLPPDDRGDELNMLSADVSYRAEHYEGKMNFVLLAGGTMIGLGVTLLVESLIALLFRIEKFANEGPDFDPGEEPAEEELAGKKQDSGEDDEADDISGPGKPALDSHVAKVKLYRSEQPFWLVDATCGSHKGLSICSGDSNAEWYTKVAPEHLGVLLAALRQKLGRSTKDDHAASREQEILDLLVIAFGSEGSNPYTPVNEFLADAGIPFTGEFWGSM
jgi:hypothetical protein